MRLYQVFNISSLVVVIVRYLIVKNNSLIKFTKTCSVKFQWDVFFFGLAMHKKLFSHVFMCVL